jgi:hypothetical protein
LAKQTIMHQDKLLALVIVAILSVSMCFMFINVAKADIIFADNFESGNFSNWTSAVGSASITTNVTSPINGEAYSADFPLSNSSCDAVNNNINTATLNYTYYVNFGPLSANYICIVLAKDANNTLIYYEVQDLDGAYQWVFNVGGAQVISSTPTFQLQQWYKIQLLAITGTNSNSTFYFLVNDQLTATITNQTFGPITEIRIGHDQVDGATGGDTYFNSVVATDITTPIIIASAGADGSISPNGSVSVNYGDTPSFTVTPDTGYYILGVTVDGTSVVSDLVSNVYTFPAVSADHAITATFAINTYTITVTQTGNGQITPGTSTANYRGSQSFTITPNIGYYIASITIDAGSVTVTSPLGQTVSFTNVQADHTISATFAPDATATSSSTAVSTSSPTPTPVPTATPTSTATSTPAPTGSPTSTPIPNSSLTVSHSQTTEAFPIFIIVTIVILIATAATLLYMRKYN